MAYRYYIVTMVKKFPAYNETMGEARYYAQDNNDAVRMCRDETRRMGHTRQDGPMTYKARLDPMQEAECARYGYYD